MLISNPKIRRPLNNLVDNFCVLLFFLAVPFAIVAGIIAGGINKAFK